MDREVRVLPVEMRMVEDGDKRTMRGEAAVFNQWSGDLGGFYERIMPGAFDVALESSDTRAYFNHDRNLILGRRSADTLRLEVGESGLIYEIDPPDTTYARDLEVSMERGDVRESSFAFTVAEGGDRIYRDDEGVVRREILQVEELFDVSPVTEPAYPQTSTSLRSRIEAVEEVTDEDAGASDEAEEVMRAHDLRRRRLELHK